jgi:hypothetical protein
VVRTRARLVAVVALLATVVPVPGSTAATGEDRVLVVLATTGPAPYTVAQFREVAQTADAFFRASSFGRMRLAFTVTPWLAASTLTGSCGGFTDRSMDGVVAPARRAAQEAGYKPEVYDQVLYALADVRCGFYGYTWGQQVVLTRPPSLELLVHELGHTLGLGHSLASTCAVRCGTLDPGDPYSPMGIGLLDFSAYEKTLLGWIGAQPRAVSSGNYTLVPPTRQTKLPQALVVDSPIGQWWLEYRTRPFRGLLVRYIDPTESVGPFSPSTTLILRPTGTKRDWVAAGETLRAAGYFTVRLTRAAAGTATLRFKWTAPRRHAFR